MKMKFLLFAFLFSCLGMSEVLAQKKIKAIYYGEKAGNSCENPCKGRCVKICAMLENYVLEGTGVIDVSYKLVNLSSGKEITTVEKVVKDTEGNVIKEDFKVYPGDIETVKRELQLDEHKNRE